MRFPTSLAMVVLPLALAGCGMVFQGSAQDVFLRTEPDSVRVALDGHDMGTTPTKLRLDRKHSHVVALKKSGYARDTLEVHGSMHPAWATLDVVSGLLPVMIDGTSGAWKRFDPELHATLTRLDTTDSSDAVLASAIEDTSRTDEGSDWLQDGQTQSVLGGRAEVLCHPHAGSAWYGEGWAEIHFGGGAMVSNHAHGKFEDMKLHLALNDSFYVLLPTAEVFRVRLIEVVGKGASIEWSRR